MNSTGPLENGNCQTNGDHYRSKTILFSFEKADHQEIEEAKDAILTALTDIHLAGVRKSGDRRLPLNLKLNLDQHSFDKAILLLNSPKHITFLSPGQATFTTGEKKKLTNLWTGGFVIFVEIQAFGLQWILVKLTMIISCNSILKYSPSPTNSSLIF